MPELSIGDVKSYVGEIQGTGEGFRLSWVDLNQIFDSFSVLSCHKFVNWCFDTEICHYQGSKLGVRMMDQYDTKLYY